MQRFLTMALAALLLAGAALAQQPQFKTQEEIDTFMLVQQAATNEERASAGGDFLAKFPKSEAVGLVSYMTMLAYQQMNDYENMMLYGGMVLEADPGPGIMTGTLLSMAGAIPARTREFDLDKEEKLSKAEDYAKRVMALIPTLQKMDPNMSDDEWLQTKMEFMSQSHEALGNVHLKREKYAEAEASFSKALEMAPQPVAYTMFNLATALSKQGKHDEAAEMADRCIAAGGMMNPAGQELCALLKKAP